MIISIDSGNRNIKSENFVFPSAIQELSLAGDDAVGIGNEILKYKGTYYSLGGERIRYMRDKTVDERFFILTLFAIAKEIKKKESDKGIRPTEPQTYKYVITLLNGLPPKHYKLKTAFKDYFLKNEVVSFNYNKDEFILKFKEVHIFPQAYAAAVTQKKLVLNEEELLVVDIGGYTLDYMLLNNGSIDMSRCESLDNGIIRLYNTIINECRDEYDIILNEKKVDALLDGTSKIKIPGIIEYAQKKAEQFVNEIVNSLREQANDLRTTPVVFVGGGSVTLKNYLLDNPNISDAYFVDDVKANAKGYRILYSSMKKKK